MNPNEYQKLAQRTECDNIPALDRVTMGNAGILATYDNEDLVNVRITHAILGMSNEVGELCKMFKTHIYHGKPLDRTNIAEELGDLMWYVALCCNATGLNLGDVMEANIAKLVSRYPEKYTDELQSEANRDKTAEMEAINSRISQSSSKDAIMVAQNPVEESSIGCAHSWQMIYTHGRDVPEDRHQQCSKCGETKPY